MAYKGKCFYVLLTCLTIFTTNLLATEKTEYKVLDCFGYRIVEDQYALAIRQTYVEEKSFHGEDIPIDDQGVCYTPVSHCAEVIESFRDELQNIDVLSLHNCHLDDGSFRVLTDHLQPHLSALQILDLSSNLLTPDCAPSLLRWLDCEKLPYLQFIYVYDTGLANKKIKLLFDRLYDQLKGIEHPRELALEKLQRVIFIQKSYLSQASSPSKVKLYNRLVEEKKLPSEWATYHRQFFSHPIYNRLIEGHAKDFATLERRTNIYLNRELLHIEIIPRYPLIVPVIDTTSRETETEVERLLVQLHDLKLKIGNQKLRELVESNY